MPSGSTGRLEKREPDHALMTASLAAHRSARCRAADELLSAASRRSPRVNVSANTVPGWATCAAKSGMETRPLPVRVALLRAECGQERLRVHQRDETREVTEPQAGDQTRLQRQLVPQPQGVAQPDQVLSAGKL